MSAILNETADKVIAAYNTWTIDAIMSFRSPDCIHQVLPLTLARPGLNNEDYRAYFAPFTRILRNWHLEGLNRTVDVEARRVVVHTRSSAESDAGKYGNEYMLTLQMTEDGREVKWFGEFVDTARSERQIPGLVELVGKL